MQLTFKEQDLRARAIHALECIGKQKTAKEEEEAATIAREASRELHESIYNRILR